MPCPAADFRGARIRREGDYLHATDMWRACGADPSRKPYEWFRQKGTRDLLAAAERQAIGGHPIASPLRSDKGDGRGGNTWLDKRVAIQYACYLDPAFAVFVNRLRDSGETPYVHVRSTVERTSMPRGGTRDVEVDEFWLTEREALLVCAASDAPNAPAVRDHLEARTPRPRL